MQIPQDIRFRRIFKMKSPSGSLYARSFLSALSIAALASTAGLCAASADPSTDAIKNAENLMKKDKYKDACSKLDEAIKANPNSAKAYCNRALVNDRLGRYSAAIEDAGKAIQLDAKASAAYVNRGWAYNKTGKYKEALEDLNRAIELDPNMPMAYVNRAHAYNGLKQYDKAIADADKAAGMKAPHARALALVNKAHALHMQGNNNDAADAATLALQINPKLSAAYVNRARSLAKQGYHDKAVDDYSKALKYNGRLAHVYHHRGLSYKAVGKDKQAQSDSETAKKMGFTPSSTKVADPR
jgi:tetratricopeptide (TPR) repeat protein